MREIIHYANDRMSNLYVAFLDIEKAFDNVWQYGLLYKLKRKSLNIYLWKIIADSFMNFKICISINNLRSYWIKVTKGVHQGGPLSGLLFQIFFDDLLSIIQDKKAGIKVYDMEFSCLAFADDLALVSLSPNELQHMVNIANQYSKKWRFHFNPRKCEIMCFGNDTKHLDIRLDNHKLKTVHRINYLGTALYNKKTIEKDIIEERIIKSYTKVWMLKSIGTANIQINPISFARGYWAAIITSLCYGLFLCGISKISLDKIDSFHVNVAKSIQGLTSNCPSVVALAGIRWQRLSS